jgi:competence protein ComEA
MSRTAWLGVVALAILGVGSLVRWWAPSREPALDCPPERVRWVQRGGAEIAVCAEGEEGEIRAGPALTLGIQLNLNSAKQEDLARIPGVGPKLAQALVEARSAAGAFQTWDEVDAVPGVGPSKLEALRTAAYLGR